MDAAGSVYVTDIAANNVTELPWNGGSPISVGTGLNAPTGVAVGASGSVYIADSGNRRLLEVPNENGILNNANEASVARG